MMYPVYSESQQLYSHMDNDVDHNLAFCSCLLPEKRTSIFTKKRWLKISTTIDANIRIKDFHVNIFAFLTSI